MGVSYIAAGPNTVVPPVGYRAQYVTASTNTIAITPSPRTYPHWAVGLPEWIDKPEEALVYLNGLLVDTPGDYELYGKVLKLTDARVGDRIRVVYLRKGTLFQHRCEVM